MSAADESTATASPSVAGRRSGNAKVAAAQAAIVVVILGAWEMLTRVPWMQKNTIFDPFFISRPSDILWRMFEWLTGFGGAKTIWPDLMTTLSATFVGLFVSVASGFLVGLALGQNRFLAKVVNPFIIAFNSMPRIAFIPLITMVFGLGMMSKVVTAWFAVFFIVFFNAYKGTVSIDKDLIDYCRTLGARPLQILVSVRAPTALAWTFAALPNAISFSLIAVVLAEFIGAPSGMGYVLIFALSAFNATNMFAAIITLSLVGIVLVYAAQAVERRLLHWSPEFR